MVRSILFQHRSAINFRITTAKTDEEKPSAKMMEPSTWSTQSMNTPCSSSGSSMTLQQNKILRVIKKNLMIKCLEMFAEIPERNRHEDSTGHYERY